MDKAKKHLAAIVIYLESPKEAERLRFYIQETLSLSADFVIRRRNPKPPSPPMEVEITSRDRSQEPALTKALQYFVKQLRQERINS